MPNSFGALGFSSAGMRAQARLGTMTIVQHAGLGSPSSMSLASSMKATPPATTTSTPQSTHWVCVACFEDLRFDLGWTLAS